MNLRNYEKHKTAKEAAEAASRHCLATGCERCPHKDAPNGHIGCITAWLYADADEKEVSK